ncbi:hypothetical protein IWW57_001057, partial [Coemansia sp. S610]
MFKKNSSSSLADTKQFQPPWLLHSAVGSSGILSLSKLWPWGTVDTRTQHTQEQELLALGGITVAGSPVLPSTESSAHSSPVLGEIMDVNIDSHGNYIHTL